MKLVGEDRFLLRRDLGGRHARRRPRHRGAEAPHGHDRGLHGPPVRKDVPNPHYIFGDDQHPVGGRVTTAIARGPRGPRSQRIAHIHPDYAFGRSFQLHFQAARRSSSRTQSSRSLGPLGTHGLQHPHHQDLAAKPDLVVRPCGAATTSRSTSSRSATGSTGKPRSRATSRSGDAPGHRQGPSRGRHGRRPLELPLHLSGAGPWPLNKQFVEQFFKRWKEYPNYAAEAAYTGLYLIKAAVEKANRRRRLAGQRPDHRGARGTRSPRPRASSRSAPRITPPSRT